MQQSVLHPQMPEVSLSALSVCVWSHQWQQAWVEEDVALCDVHAADQLT